MAERRDSRWSEPFLVNPDELTPEQLEKVRARNAAMRKYYRTGDPRELIRLGIFPEGLNHHPDEEGDCPPGLSLLESQERPSVGRSGIPDITSVVGLRLVGLALPTHRDR